MHIKQQIIKIDEKMMFNLGESNKFGALNGRKFENGAIRRDEEKVIENGQNMLSIFNVSIC